MSVAINSRFFSCYFRNRIDSCQRDCGGMWGFSSKTKGLLGSLFLLLFQFTQAYRPWPWGRFIISVLWIKGRSNNSPCKLKLRCTERLWTWLCKSCNRTGDFWFSAYCFQALRKTNFHRSRTPHKLIALKFITIRELQCLFT